MINNAIISPIVARKEFMDFFGREEEIGDLMALWSKRCGSLAPVVEVDGYFDAIVPFRELLGL